MKSSATRTPEGDAATNVVLATFRANGLLLAAGHRLAAREGLTAARWQVLGAVALARRQARWINELAAGLKISDLAAAARLLHDLSDRLEATAPTGRKEKRER